MKDGSIRSFDATAEMTRKLMELCATTMDAARQAQVSPPEEEMLKGMIRAALLCLSERTRELFPWPEAEAFTGTHLSAILNNSGEALLQAANDWWMAYTSHLAQNFFDALCQSAQISAQAAAATAELAEIFPLSPESWSKFLYETALRCGCTAPGLSAEIMTQAFNKTPAMLKDKLPHLKGYVYEPGKHAQVEFTHCPACGGEGRAYHTACSCLMGDFNARFLPVKLWMRCQNCGILYTRWFSQEYLDLCQETRRILPRPDQFSIRQANSMLLRSWNDILNTMRELAPSMSTDLLEVGVGNGHLIAMAREMGYTVTAVEISEHAAQETADLLGCSILCGDFLKMPENQQFDLITMGDVLEHLTAPAEGVAKAFRLLKPGGCLWLSTPNFESAFTTMMKAKDPMWCEPYHITYFSRKTLTKLLETTGFVIERYAASIHYNGSMELFAVRPEEKRI